MQKTFLFLRISSLYVYSSPVFPHPHWRYRQLVDRSWPLDSNNTSCISYAIQSREFVPHSFDLFWTTRHEYMYHIHVGPLDGTMLCYGAFTLQVVLPNQCNGLAKRPRVDDKLSGFITSNEANRLRHPVWLNVGKKQRKAGRLHSLEGLCIQETGILLCALCLQAHPSRFWLRNIFFNALPTFSSFFGRNFHHLAPSPMVTIAGLSNSRYCILVKHF